MARDPRIRFMFMLAALAVFFLVGCGDDDPVKPPADTGTIVIDQTPNALVGAGWTLTGPQTESGSGDATLADMPVGQYTLTWAAVSGYITPSSDTQTLATDGTITFSGTYVEDSADTGTIVIDQTPNALVGAGWTLTGPQTESGSGDATLADMPVGQYTLTWAAVSGYITPSSDTQTLAADGTLTFSGTYVTDPGPTTGFVQIPAGTFQMGSPTDEPGRSPNETLHTVTLTQGFYMSRTEVTEEWWDAVMGSGSSTSQLPKGDVSWDQAVAFCNQLSLDEGLTPAYTINGPNGDATWNHAANGYRLPTEAEWEYACRGGSQAAFCNGPITNISCSPLDPNLDQVGWYCGNSGYTSHEVGQKTANAWGLHDMHGNLWEWVWDGYRADYQNLPSEDPVYDVGPGTYRVIRGGNWYNYAQYCRSANRCYVNPNGSSDSIGFRPVRSTN